MKKLILIILLVAVTVSLSRAQQTTGDVSIQQVTKSFDNGSVVSSENFDGIFANSMFISELQQMLVDANQVARINLEGNNNTASIVQDGTNNVGVIDITGSANSSTLFQDGSGMLSAIGINGYGNKLDVTQKGTALQNLILLEGQNLDFNVLQNAAGVKLTQTGSSIPLQIESTGSTVPLIIRNN